jgi:dihydroflavonol-4-reductase
MTVRDIPSPVFVTGAGGLIGSAICEELSRRGVSVRALLAPGESDENIRKISNLTTAHGDIRDAEHMNDLVAGCRAIIHTAALNTLWHKPARDFYSINVRGSHNICMAALNAGATSLIFTSSCEVLGPAGASNSRSEERAPLEFKRVHGHYERSKFLAEIAVREHAEQGLCITILRPTAVIGPGDIHTTPPGMLIRAFLEKRIPAYFDAGINVVDSRDVALAHVMALERSFHNETFIVGAYNVRFSDLLGEMSAASGIPAPARKVGYRTALAGAALRQMQSLFTREHPGITINGIRTIKHDWFFDTTKLRTKLGLKPRPLSETIRAAVEWHLKTVTGDS